MSGLTRDETAEPASRDQTGRCERDYSRKHNFPCLADHEQGLKPYTVDTHSLASPPPPHTHKFQAARNIAFCFVLFKEKSERT